MVRLSDSPNVPLNADMLVFNSVINNLLICSFGSHGWSCAESELEATVYLVRQVWEVGHHQLSSQVKVEIAKIEQRRLIYSKKMLLQNRGATDNNKAQYAF